MFFFPEQYGVTQDGIQVTSELLQEAFTQSDSADKNCI